MIVGLTTPTASTRSVVLDRPEAHQSRLREISRRVLRTATLDGGAVLTDQGFAEADRTLAIRARVNDATATAVEYLLRSYPTVVVSCVSGCYLAALSDLSYQDGVLQLTALVSQKLSEA